MALSSLRRLSWLRVLVASELTFALVVAGGLVWMRRQTLDSEARMLDALAHAMALQADRTLDIAEVTLQATGDELSRGLVAPAGPQTDAWLRERVRALPCFRAISLFDTAGRRVATSRPATAAPPTGVQARDFFQAARASTAPRLYLSEPYVALGDGRPAVSLSVGWFDAQGRFAGVVALVADPDFLAGGLGRVAGDKDVQQAIVRLQAPPGAGPANPVHPVGPEVPVEERLRRAFAPPSASGTRPALMLASGRQPVLATAVPLTRLPLLQAVWRDADAVLSGWADLAWLVGSFVVAMLAVTLGVGLRLARHQLQLDALEQRLARGRQVEALGQLAGGVAHDFNNVLAAVLGFGEMARQDAAAGSRQARHLDQVLQAAERGRQQVERILAFSRGQPRRRTPFRLQPVVQEVLDHLAASRPAAVQVQAELRAPGAAVRGDATATYEAVMNLCTNALQAMPAGGRLAVSLDALHLSAPRPTDGSPLPPGEYLRLQVRDSGQGMSPEVLAHLFEPFFTTKGRHGGNGIGLAVVHGVVADLGGAIDVDSTPGRGTCFTLLLPVTDLPAAAPEPEAGELPRGQGQTVLVVDDEPALVELAEEMLAALGYDPRGTVSSVQALQALQENPAQFDLLLTDEVMPEMNGTALARAALALRPGLPVVLASGYGGEQFEARAAEAGVHTVLAKPLTQRALAIALHQALQVGRSR